MCGIAGTLNFEAGRPAGRDTISAMCGSIVHRGPDDEGILVNGPLAMGMRRLSIIDLAGGHQPIWNEDKTVAVVFNGELYNFQETRSELEARGHTFATRSDTEIIVHLYEEHGDECVQYLRGMFAFAVWDLRKQRLLIARDRLGIKPLYYAEQHDRLLFGSELKTLLAAGIDREIDRQALHDYLTLTHIPAPATIFRAARKLEPGCRLIVERGKVKIERWWTLDYTPFEPGRSEESILGELECKLDDAIRSHLVADVPLGVFLSGGVDSAALVSGMRRFHSGPLKTFSIGFEEKSFSELDRARIVARAFDTEHHELVVQPEIHGLIGRLVNAFDEPYADSSAIPLLCVSELARKHVKVALSGEGGDEVFAGYKTYTATLFGRWYRRLVPGPLRRLAPALAGLLPVRHTKVSLDYMARRFASGAQGSGDELAMHLAWKAIFDEAAKDALYVDGSAGLAPTLRLFESASSDIDPDDLLARMLATDTRVGLEGDMLVKADRMTMAVSLEGRVPLLDHPLVEFMARVPSRLKMKGFEKKYLLRRVMRPRLPRETLDGPKQGFNVPIPAWLLGPLREFMHDTLAPERVRAVGLFQPEVVSRLIADHENRVRDASRDIWTLLMFQSWFDGISGSAATPSGLGATPETPKFPG